MSKVKRIFILLSALLLLIPTLVSAQQVTLPPVDLAASSFRDGVGGPGLMLQERIQNSDVQYSKSWLFMNQASYITGRKILGGYYGFEALLPVIKLNAIAGVRPEQAGAGDLIVSPFQLQWINQKLFGRPYFHRLNLSFIVPTGQYSDHSTVNIGNNVFSFDPYYAVTWFITPKLETSWRFHYMWNSRNNDPPIAFKATNIQPGQAFHFNFGTSYEIVKGLGVGVSGFYLRQTTFNKVDGDEILNSTGKGVAIGPGVMYSKNNWTLTFTADVKTWVDNRPSSRRFTLCIKKTFPSKQR